MADTKSAAGTASEQLVSAGLDISRARALIDVLIEATRDRDRSAMFLEQLDEDSLHTTLSIIDGLLVSASAHVEADFPGVRTNRREVSHA